MIWIVGCFVAGQSAEYRAIHLLFVFPGLTAWAGTRGPARHLARCMVWIMMLQLWGDVVSAPLAGLAQAGGAHADAGRLAFLLVWLVRELAWWWTVAMLMALLAALLPARRQADRDADHKPDRTARCVRRNAALPTDHLRSIRNCDNKRIVAFRPGVGLRCMSACATR